LVKKELKKYDQEEVRKKKTKRLASLRKERFSEKGATGKLSHLFQNIRVREVK